MVAFVKILSEYLGEPIKPDSPILGADFKTDGSLLCQVGPVSLPVYIQELKNEVRACIGRLYIKKRQLQDWRLGVLLPSPFPS